MSYETAPATRMLATHCAVCRRPLVDAASVEAGIGPDCREKHGYDIDVNEDARREANKLVHEIAVGADPSMLPMQLCALRVYGFDRLADVIIDRQAKVKVTVAAQTHHGAELLALETPYNPEFTEALKHAVVWRKWDREAKVWLVPAGARNAVWAVLKRFFKGTLGVGPRGPFMVAL